MDSCVAVIFNASWWERSGGERGESVWVCLHTNYLSTDPSLSSLPISLELKKALRVGSWRKIQPAAEQLAAVYEAIFSSICLFLLLSTFNHASLFYTFVFCKFSPWFCLHDTRQDFSMISFLCIALTHSSVFIIYTFGIMGSLDQCMHPFFTFVFCKISPCFVLHGINSLFYV